MKSISTSLVSCSLLFLKLASAQFTLLEIFTKYSQLSKLAALVTNSTTLSARFFDQASNFTLLAPTDTAISTWLSSNVSQADIEAVLLYHLLDGRHPMASISNSSMVISSVLTNQTYANITGGQRVEVSNTGVVEFQSDAKAISKVIAGDIVGNDGFIHIIDKVLDIPSIFGVAASKANLTYLIDLVDKGNYLRNTTYSWDIASRRDSTYLAPNSALALAHIPPDGTQTSYNALLEYHCISQLVYSTDLVNGTELSTFNGGKVLITVDKNGTTYANNAKVIGTDYLVFNGVMHILDDIMIPQNVPGTPASTPSNITSNTTSSIPIAAQTDTLSVGTKVGIGIGAIAIAIMILSILLLVYRRRRARKNPLSIGKSQDNLSLQEMTRATQQEAQEMDTMEPATQPSAFLPPVQETIDISMEEGESAPSSPIADLPLYPRRADLENQEPKSLSRVLENGGLEPKSLNTPLERPKRPP